MNDDTPGGPSPRRWKSAPNRTRSGALPLFLSMLLVAGLVGLAFLQARLLSPLLFRARDAAEGGAPPVNLPEREVRVLVTPPGESPGLMLKTSLDLPEANEEDAARIDRVLFPDGPAHRYWLFVVRNGTDREVVLDLDPAGIRLRGGGTEWRAADLAGALAARAGGVPPSLLLWLRLRVPEGRRVTVRPGGGRQVLLAFPADAVPARVEEAAISGRRLRPETVRKDALDDRMAQRDDDGAPDDS